MSMLNPICQTKVVLKSRIRVYAISDLHTDGGYGADSNAKWVDDNCNPSSDDCFSILIVPGDVSSNMERLDAFFEKMASRFDAVCYVTGNHEAWLESKDTYQNSFKKIDAVLKSAENHGIYTGPTRFIGEGFSMLIVSLYAWYHSGFDSEPDLENSGLKYIEEVYPFNKRWSDFKFCKWENESSEELQFELEGSTDDLPPSLTIDNLELPRIFDAMNDRAMVNLDRNEDDTVISFSHFLPRIECSLEKRYLLEPMLPKVVGSNALERQIRKLLPHCHLYGHTHVPLDFEIDGITYIQWPLGLAREASPLQCGPVRSVGPMLVADSALGRGAAGIVPARERPSMQAYWSQHYAHNKRDISVQALSPWLMKRVNERLQDLTYNI